ncbi:MAG TPA: 1,4-dihydroxy-2-naphthoate octaprenyltransferase [Dehalococcoidia bacterium]|nr:1,4-dihydroxy-2-naphthoate octaprenyltransferase [Dehalococcoidia bacterium]
MAAAAPAITRRRAWFLATRPFSAPASIVPVCVGAALAAEIDFRPVLFVLTFLGSVLIHAGTNLATDFFDFTDGVQPRDSLGGASIRRGVLSASEVHRAAIAAFGAGSILGLVIVLETGWPVLAAGFASVLAGYFYTAAPISYGRRGLGEVMVFVFMGPLMVMAAYYVQLERLTWASFYASLPVGILVANILHANNLRDIENDRARRKLTIATAIDRPASDYVLYALVIAAFAVVIVCVALDALTPWSLLVALAAPAAIATLRELRHRDAATLNGLVRASARLHMHFGMLLALGFVIAALT